MTTHAHDIIHSKVNEIINRCVGACLDGEKTFALAAINVRDETLKSIFHRYASEREGFVRALQGKLEELGGYAGNQGSSAASIRHALSGARMALEGRKDTLVLDECEREELAALRAYDRALAMLPDESPDEVRTLLVTQRGAIETAYWTVTNEDLRRRATQH